MAFTLGHTCDPTRFGTPFSVTQISLAHRLAQCRIPLVSIICKFYSPTSYWLSLDAFHSLSSKSNFIGPPAGTTSHSIGRHYMQI
ncbi:hypothetical protein T01_3785 [Trichinella spiralis]|uniref:Uncharacterized protein n=1 Tax=Trichinella spiralis TaxID=6334 RepID=A0A0V1AMW0_TRISP|nr:hypothetical protein T01_3785 [Trichinella spiralis]